MTGQVKEAWGALAAREGWEKLPKYALGVSSGASMVRHHSMAFTPLQREVHLKNRHVHKHHTRLLLRKCANMVAIVAADLEMC